MLKLYYNLICPKSRFISVLLRELELDHEKEKIDFWKEKKRLSEIDPIGELPILVTSSNVVISTIYSICNYLIDLFPDKYLVPPTPEEKAEMRRMIYWLDTRFDKEVAKYFINEKFLRLVTLSGSPKTDHLRAARINLLHHASYFNNLMQKNGFLSYKNISYSDLFLACHISVLDYFGEVNWDKLSWLAAWYAPIKSRPSFRPMLKERLSIITPPSYYENPDF